MVYMYEKFPSTSSRVSVWLTDDLLAVTDSISCARKPRILPETYIRTERNQIHAPDKCRAERRYHITYYRR